jgi:hypothetical protein
MFHLWLFPRIIAFSGERIGLPPKDDIKTENPHEKI